jgi:hypothetical protein
MAAPERERGQPAAGRVRRVAGAVALGAFAVALFGSFYCNFWGVTDDRWFLTHQHDTESLVIGRLVKSRKDGVFSAGGFPGAGIDADLSATWIYPDQIAAQYRAYLENGHFEVFSPYCSQPGGQGLTLSLLDRLLPFAPATRLEVLYALMSLLSALTFIIIIWWFSREAGVVTAGMVALSVILSQWLTVFGRNLWWNLWAFFVPMLAIALVLGRHRGRPCGRVMLCEVGLAAFLGILIKYVFNGFEFITTTVAMALVPVAYEAVRERWPGSVVLKLGGTALAAAAVAVGVAVVLLVLQIAVLRGDAAAGIAHVTGVLAKRSHGAAAHQPALYAPALTAGVAEVIGRYLDGNYFAMRWSQWGRDTPAWWGGLRLPYGWLIVAFCVVSVLVIKRVRSGVSPERRVGLALVVATWFSFLAPLSWFVIFKAHSFVHLHVNFVIWQMPFALFGFALLGWLMGDALRARGRFALTRPPAGCDA